MSIKSLKPGMVNSSSKQNNTLGVIVQNYKDEVVEGAAVAIQQAESRQRIKLSFDKKLKHYVASGVDVGAYTLSIESKDYESQERTIHVQPGFNVETVILGTSGMPFYYRGTVKVPFTPHENLVAVRLKPRLTPQDSESFDALTKSIKGREEKVSSEILKSGVRVLRFVDGKSERVREDSIKALMLSPLVASAGQVVSLRERSISYLSNELIVKFKSPVNEQAVRELAEKKGITLLRTLPYSANTFQFSVPGVASYRLLKTIAELHETEIVEWAEPNLHTIAELDHVNPPDFLWNGVWDRQLVNTPDAWQALQDAGLQTFGDPNLIIAIVDQGIESVGGVPTHPDFQGTVSSGASKVYGLYDFINLLANNDNPIGDHGMGTAGVATAIAGNPAPVAGQTEGLAGCAPNCRVMGLIYPSSDTDIADMYIWGAGFDPDSPRAGFPAPLAAGADVFSTSIGFGAGAPISGTASAMLDYLTTYGRNGKGCLCFFSSGNANNEFTTYRPYAAYKKSFGITASTIDDDGVTEIRAPYSGYGVNAKFCAPSHDEFPTLHNPPVHYATWSAILPGTGNLIGHSDHQTTLSAAALVGATSITVVNTTGIVAGSRLLIGLPGTAGSEPVTVTGAPNPVTNLVPVSAILNAHAVGATVSVGPNNYRNNFGGTSSATPLSAGVAALVLSANPALTWIEVKQILRDTAVKIQIANTDPIAQWLDVNGNPSVTSGLPAVFSRAFGYGRVNAAAAVNTALTYTPTRDMVIRDNLGDTGMVPSGGAFWNSPDIWVRNASPSSEGALALPAGYAVEGPHQSPQAGSSNWVYVRVRNNGIDSSLDCYVRVYVCHWPGTEFTYPQSFIPTNRPGAAVPSPLTPGTYLLGEIPVTNIAPGADTIVNVEWPASLIPPQDVMVGTTSVHWHPCLLVEISPHDGPVATGNHVWDSNNLAQKNLTIIYVADDKPFAAGLVIGNAENKSNFMVLEIDRSHLPPNLSLYVDLVSPRLKSLLREFAQRRIGLASIKDDLQLYEEFLRVAQPPCEAIGNKELLSLSHTQEAALNTLAGRKLLDSCRGTFAIEKVQGREVAVCGPRGKARIPVFVARGDLQQVVIGGVLNPRPALQRKDILLLQRRYVIVVQQLNAYGERSGAIEIELRAKAKGVKE